MSFPTAYTALESLLLFQALRAEGVIAHSVFSRISDQLKNIPLIRIDPSFDAGRLSPDALREFYLWLLKDEVKKDLVSQLENESRLQNGDVSPGSRKRKAPSPSLPTVHEATKHAHLIPQLVMRLYTRYREHTIPEIREHERRYDALTREIGEIEAGKWDESLQRQRTASATQSPRPSSSAHTQPAVIKPEYVQPTSVSTASPVSPEKTFEGNTQTQTKPYSRNKIGDVINHDPEPQNAPPGHRRASSNTTLPPLSEMAPQSPRFGIPPKMPGPITTQLQSHGYSHSPPSAHQSPYAPHHGHPMSSPQVQNSMSRPPSSPRPILPPPPGMKLPPPSPVQHTDSPNLHGPSMPHQLQYPPQPPPHRLSTGPSPATDRPPRGYASPQMPTHLSGYYQQPTYSDRRTSYPPPQQQYIQPVYPTQAPHAGGYQLPPFSVEPQEPMQGRPNIPLMQQHQHSSVPQPSSNHTQRPPYPQHPPNVSSTASTLVPEPNSAIVSDIIAALATPPRPQRNRSFKRVSHLQVGTPMPSPKAEVEPLSPTLNRTEPSGRSRRSTRRRDAATSDRPAWSDLVPKSSRKGRLKQGRLKRDRSPHSIVSSTADESAQMTRSQSTSTAAGAIQTSDDRPGSRGNVKLEPSTPAGFVEDPEAAQEIPLAGGRMTRKRRGTLQSHPQPPSKRKRPRSPSAPTDQALQDLETPPPRPTTVIATRNFHKMSGTIMNDINSHKHASYFANLVRDKDAPGYSEIIKQPQHLKSLRTAIAMGAKAVNAAVAAMESPSGVSDGVTTVELERTEDLCPPKAIVNGAQLEKEVMRMFANAVMFNPGEDGMVSDTREMCEEVEAKIREWRGAEKEAGEGEEEEGKGKRRKL